jgi:hypothetical protein
MAFNLNSSLGALALSMVLILCVHYGPSSLRTAQGARRVAKNTHRQSGIREMVDLARNHGLFACLAGAGYLPEKREEFMLAS